MPAPSKSILLIISGGIAAYKIPELIRKLGSENIAVTCIMTKAAEQFVTPLTLASLSGSPVYHQLFDLKDETEIGHIQLSRQADLVVVAPATANIIAKIAHGLADNLATTCLLATDKPVLIAPAMNVKMWENSATQRNIQQLRQDGVAFSGPEHGEMACGETGTGRMSDISRLAQDISHHLTDNKQTLPLPFLGKHILITAGPTHEAIDPVRYIANHSSGKQGYALATQAALMGATVTLVSGPVYLPTPSGVQTVRVTSAIEMQEAVQSALPADIAICAAAVADWRVTTPATEKMKKENNKDVPTLSFTQNPDILHMLATHPTQRPELVIGFAAETQDVIHNAQTKLARKKCDLIIANNVSPETGTFGGENNQIHLITPDTVTSLKQMTKKEVSKEILQYIIKYTK